ncbi:TadE family type IV pilus minor pilin [Corynebacterium sp. USCH3]|uniref:TadE family type IV pilus minor pilin n=1 Tax=Corynebacterium sp. USCH3 TaxID=3024840 RepID=UPI0030A3AB1A
MPGRWGDEDGYVTVEAAIVFTALTAVIGLVVAGVLTVAAYLGAVGMARDGARAAALGDVAAARAVVAERDPQASVAVDSGPLPTGPSGDQQLFSVRVTVPGRLFDVSATAVIVGEPQTVR